MKEDEVEEAHRLLGRVREADAAVAVLRSGASAKLEVQGGAGAWRSAWIDREDAIGALRATRGRAIKRLVELSVEIGDGGKGVDG